MKATIISLLLIFFGVIAYCQSEADIRKAKLSMTGSVADDRPADDTPTYRARYKGSKAELEEYIDAKIRSFVVECIRNNADDRKFIGRDELNFYFTLSDRGVIDSVRKVSATFSLSEEKKVLLSNQIIGMENWKLRRNRPNTILVWKITFQWM